MENQKLFNTWKAQVEEIDPTCQLDCLRIIEVNLSNVCNFKCPFCPQSKDWPIKDPKFMSLDTAKEIAKQLKSFNFQGYICTAGFGEPALNPQFMEILEAFKGFNIVIVSNGALRSSKDWEHLSSFAQIKISVHYWDKRSSSPRYRLVSSPPTAGKFHSADNRSRSRPSCRRHPLRVQACSMCPR